MFNPTVSSLVDQSESMKIQSSNDDNVSDNNAPTDPSGVINCDGGQQGSVAEAALQDGELKSEHTESLWVRSCVHTAGKKNLYTIKSDLNKTLTLSVKPCSVKVV